MFLVRSSASIFSFFSLSRFCKIVIHGVWPVNNYPWLLLAIFLQINYTICPHGNFEQPVFQNKKLLKKLYLKIFLIFAIKNAFKILVFSSKEKKSVKCIFPSANVLEGKLGADPLDFRSFRKQPKTYRKNILFIGRLDPLKGILELVIAYAQSKAFRNPLIIIGDGCPKFKKLLHQLIHKLMIQKHVKLLGPRSKKNIGSLFKETKYLVLPSKSESFGLVVAEALANRIPVLTTTATPWAISSSSKGCFCVEPSIEGLKRGLLYFNKLQQKKLTKMGKIGQAYVKKHHSWNTLARLSLKRL